jgi:hypothetical protein
LTLSFSDFEMVTFTDLSAGLSTGPVGARHAHGACGPFAAKDLADPGQVHRPAIGDLAGHDRGQRIERTGGGLLVHAGLFGQCRHQLRLSSSVSLPSAPPFRTHILGLSGDVTGCVGRSTTGQTGFSRQSGGFVPIW